MTAIVGGEPVGAPVLANLAKEQVKRLDGGSLTVYYSVNGQPESEHLVLSVGVAAPSLPIPTVVEAPNDILNPDDVNPLIGVNVHATHTATIPEDVVVLRWRGSSSNAPDQSRTLTGTTAGKLVPFTVPFRYVTENLNGTVDVSYSITRGTTLLGNSIVRHLTVGSVLDLTAPSVKEANGASLNPVDAKDRLTVVVPDNAALRPDDKLKVTWTGAPGTPAEGSHTSGEWPVRDGWNVSIPNSVVAFSLGKAVTVTYTVIQNGVESPPSDPFTLNVQVMPVASLPMPLIPEAAQGGIGSVLDLSSFSGDARVTVAPWPLIAAGQRVWLSCEGIASDGSNYTIPLYTGSEVSSSQVTGGLSTPLLRSELEKLRDGSELKVVLLVTFNRSTNQSESVTFPLRIYAVRTVGKLTIDTSVMRLDGLSIKIDWPRTGVDSDNNTGIRRASGGRLPYRFTSRNSDIASVRSDNAIVGEANGMVYIDVSDAYGDTVFFPVVVSNVHRLVVNEGPFISGAEAMRWVDSVSGQARMNWPAFEDIEKVYSKPYPYPYRRQHYWLYPDLPEPNYSYFNYVTQSVLLADPDNRQISGCMALMRT